jgi:hypothetical protein
MRLHMPVAAELMAELSRMAHNVPVVQAAVTRRWLGMLVNLSQRGENGMTRFDLG